MDRPEPAALSRARPTTASTGHRPADETAAGIECRARGRIADWLTIFGRVPFFYYVLHIPLIHALALLVSKIRLGEVSPWLFTNHPVGNPPAPDGYTWSLGLLYLVWAVTVLLLYLPCRWYADLKARRQDWWLKYL